MPYIVTTKRPVDAVDCGHPEVPRDGWPVSRRAVVTLEGARWFAQRPGWRYTGADAEPAMKVYRAARALPESGGTVGPFPDGTVIEVEPIEWRALARRAGLLVSNHMGQEQILDAFNTREATA